MLPRAERQAQILRAAARAFARAGFAATSMDDVAAEAGVTKLIVYRHFEGKDDLYRSVLESVNERLMAAIHTGPASRGRTVRAMLSVARDDPAGFRLIAVHAPREPQFAEHVALYRKGALETADALVGTRFADPVWRQWADRVVLDHAVSAVLHWLDVGEPARDEEFVARVTDGTVALLDAWWLGAGDPDGGR